MADYLTRPLGRSHLPQILSFSPSQWGALHFVHFKFALRCFLGGKAIETLGIDEGLQRIVRVTAEDLEKHACTSADFSEEELAEAVGRVALLKEYVERQAESPNDFFQSLALKAQHANMDMGAFLRRDNVWDEELLIPQFVEPDYLLAYISGSNWYELSKSK